MSQQPQQETSQEKLLLIQKSLAIMVNQKEKIITELNAKLQEKDKEIQRLTDLNKQIESKNQELFKNATQATISDVTEIQDQNTKDKRLLNEMIKTLQNDILSKNTLITKLNDELTSTRSQLQLERQLNLKYFSQLTPLTSSSASDKLDIRLHKISSENTSLKASLLTKSDTIDILSSQNTKLTETINDLTHKLNETESKHNQSFTLLKTSYDNLIKDFHILSEQYAHSKQSLSELTNNIINNERDYVALQSTNTELEKEKIAAMAENESMKKRIQSYTHEVEALHKEINKLETIISDYKLAKQVFFVTYSYMNLQMSGNITIEKDGNNYNFIIQNRTATRKLTFLDVDVMLDDKESNKVVIKFNKEGNVMEDYYTKDSKEAVRLFKTFNDFRKKAIEETDIASSIKTQQAKEEKVMKTEKEINNFLGMI